MFRLNVLIRCKSLLDNISFEKICPSTQSLVQLVQQQQQHGFLRNYHLHHQGHQGEGESGFSGCGSGNSKGRGTLSFLSSNGSVLSSLILMNRGGGGQLQQQQVRFGHTIVDGGMKYHRRRAKAAYQRSKVLKPSSPVIDHLYPLPPSNEGKYPEHLFGNEVQRDPIQDEMDRKGVVAEVNKQIGEQSHGRLFAVISLVGKQFKVTPEDIIIIQGYWAPNVGDRLRLHKILLVGGKDFTMVGRPVLDDSFIRIEGTVVEKTLSYTKLHFILRKRKNFRRLKFFKEPYTMLRINMIELVKPLSALKSQPEVEDAVVDSQFKIATNT